MNNEEKQFVDAFQEYCINHLFKILAPYASDIAKLRKRDFIIILLRNISVNQYENAILNYRKDYVFNTTAADKTVVGGQEYGLSNFNNVASEKKPYLKHLTAPFLTNNKISIKKAILLNTFERYRQQNAFKTTPLPVFIDDVERNREVINIVQFEGHQVSFRKIIYELFKNRKDDLGNYYLIYFKGSNIRDLDFVSSFQFSLNIRLRQAIPKAQHGNDIPIKDIFQFEKQISQPIFNNQLRNNYFIDISERASRIKNPDHPLKNSIIQSLLYKYRKAFYDYIYKSRKQAITPAMFHDIMQKGILYDIRHDKIKTNEKGKKYHTRTSNIYKKLNIWFSLWNYFINKTPTNDLTMANKIVNHQERIRDILNSESDEHIQTDDEFGFGMGQIIYFLLSKSKAANKTHALVEPFIQKTDVRELKKALINTLHAYSHEINFYKGRFEKLFGEVMDYEPDEKLKELLPFTLAGYFSKSLIYEKTKS